MEPGIGSWYSTRGGRRLHITYHEPVNGVNSKRGIVLCPAFGEEAECARRTYHVTAQALSRIGYSVLVPDLLGTGNSAGSLIDVRLEDWRSDIIHCSRVLSDRMHAGRIGLLGHRFGGVLALLAAESLPLLELIVLWDPPRAPEKHFIRMLRRKLVREAFTLGSAVKTREQLIEESEERGSVDFDGYEISTDLIRDLARLGWANIPVIRRSVRNVGIADVRARGLSSGVRESLEKMLPASSIDVFYNMSTPNFWSRLGVVVASDLIETTAGWIQRIWPNGAC